MGNSIKVGSFKQKANWFLVGFVFGCIFIIIILLYIIQKAEATANNINSVTKYDNQVSY